VIITRRMSPLVQAMLAMGIVGAPPAVAEVAPVIRERQPPPPPPIAVDLPKPLVVPPRSELPTGTLPPRLPPPPPLPVVRADPAAKARRKAEKKARKKNRR